MSLDLHFELRLEEREADRVFVSVVLAPTCGATGVDGVSLQMVDRTGEPMSARVVLPLAGEVAQPLLTTVEVRARGAIPAGSRVVGHAWRGQEQVEAACPADPGTQLEVHMRGRRIVPIPAPGLALRPLDGAERARLARVMPWIDEPARRAPERPAVVDSAPSTPEDVAEEVAQQYDLDPEDAAFLKELLGEE